MLDELLVLIKGAGDLASGVAWRLHRCGFPVVMTELPQPTTVRRGVAFAQAVYCDEQTVEGVTARHCHPADVPDVLLANEIPILMDPYATALSELRPSVVVDGIMAKRNTGTSLGLAPLVVALGPGFVAGMVCHAVVETHRGHRLGRAIWQGSALANTGTPGRLPGGESYSTRVLRAPATGRVRPHYEIGEIIQANRTIATLETERDGSIPVMAPFTGVLRGLIHQDVLVQEGLKIGDLDPRAEPAYAWTISDKSLSVAGGVLEAILSWTIDRKSNQSTELDDDYL